MILKALYENRSAWTIVERNTATSAATVVTQMWVSAWLSRFSPLTG